MRASDLKPVLSLLLERGYIMRIPNNRQGPGRNPSPLYAVNPLLHAQNTQITQNQLTVISS